MKKLNDIYVDGFIFLAVMLFALALTTMAHAHAPMPPLQYPDIETVTVIHTETKTATATVIITGTATATETRYNISTNTHLGIDVFPRAEEPSLLAPYNSSVSTNVLTATSVSESILDWWQYRSPPLRLTEGSSR
jgi:hypothetical protein